MTKLKANRTYRNLLITSGALLMAFTIYAQTPGQVQRGAVPSCSVPREYGNPTFSASPVGTRPTVVFEDVTGTLRFVNAGGNTGVNCEVVLTITRNP